MDTDRVAREVRSLRDTILGIVLIAVAIFIVVWAVQSYNRYVETSLAANERMSNAGRNAVVGY